jgi:hypothetical protein
MARWAMAAMICMCSSIQKSQSLFLVFFFACSVSFFSPTGCIFFPSYNENSRIGFLNLISHVCYKNTQTTFAKYKYMLH